MENKNKNSSTLLLFLLILAAFFCVYFAEHKMRLHAISALRESEATIATLQSELQNLRRENAEKISNPTHVLPTAHQPAAQLPESDSVKPPSELPRASSSDESEEQAFRAQARLSVLEKFVSLTDEQRDELQQRMLDDQKNGTNSLAYEEGDERDPLADVIGAENAKHYREQVKNAFRQAESEAREKEILLYVRKLGLDAAAETKFRDTVNAVDAELDASRQGRPKGEKSSMRQRVQAIIEENRQRENLLKQRLQTILSAAQMAAFEAELAQSSDSDFEMLHDGQ